jgi:putative endonuclease
MESYFYIPFSQSANQFYIGHTAEPVEERLRKHNSDDQGFTGKVHDWRIVHNETFENKQLGYSRERELKAWKSRKRSEKLIAGSGHRAK